MLVMDSGLGGLSVVRALRATRPGLPLLYLADTAGFPYGSRDTADLTVRASTLIAALRTNGPIVLACNTLSTLCLSALRAQFAMPFVGTVPAIKVAAAQAQRFTVLATPNTAHSRYTDTLIAEFAPHCVVDTHPAPDLASLAERILLGEMVDPARVRAEILPAFHDDAHGRTEAIVLGCTHYPLILDSLRAVAPWPVVWIDSSDAIARRVLALDDVPPPASVAYVTDRADVPRYRDLFAREGFSTVESVAIG